MTPTPAGGRGAAAAQPDSGALPALLSGKRRRLMAGLVCTGLGVAALSASMAFLMIWMLSSGPERLPPALVGLGCTVIGVGICRILERVLAEKLGQNYVQQIRKGLVRQALSPYSRTSVGITIARATNDLSSVRNWIIFGLAPIAVAVPSVLGTGAALWFLSPPLAVAALVPLLFLAVALGFLSGPALSRTREVRRRRGRLAAQIADTVAAAAAIEAAGGTSREVGRIGLLAERMVDAAVKQATIAGCLRASAAVTAATAVVAVAGTGVLLGIDTATIAAGLTAAGMMSTPVTDTGRIVEYRQKFLAARHILAPLLSTARLGQRVQAGVPAVENSEAQPVCIRDASFHSGPAVPDLCAEPGQRVVIRSAAPEDASALCRALIGLDAGVAARVLVGDLNILALAPAVRRTFLGYAGSGVNLERGSIARAVRYRRPDLPPSVTAPSLAAVGLLERVNALPAGDQTRLHAGGKPLTRSERARLQLARAALGDPALLVLDHIDRDLGAAGCTMARAVLNSYPGVVVIASENPGALVEDFKWWEIGTS